ncbi:unnamed protein product [Paramecium sonneborni]|uniref:Uncharacterized protein n=1 Tax=Paramecium sonneborni TaxID=65129 RepID=A0A8S1R9N7_9CILI|nr:unnamed protein product [Paramecium sonneborni]
MANQFDTISFPTSSKLHQHNPSYDSHLHNKMNQCSSDINIHHINREIFFIADQALKLKQTIQQHSDLYKYIIRIVEISMKARDVDNNKKLLDDIVEELSIILTHSLNSKTIYLLLNKLIQLYKKKQSIFNNSDTNIKKFALLFNNQSKTQNKIFLNFKDSPRIHNLFQKSQSPTSQYSNSRIFQAKNQDQIYQFQDPYNINNERLKAILDPSINSHRQKNYYISKY